MQQIKQMEVTTEIQIKTELILFIASPAQTQWWKMHEYDT